MDLKELQKKYPKFVYESYSVRISKNDLEIIFSFKIKPNISFEPKVVIKNTEKELLRVGVSNLDNLIFHLGLIEMVSYWKATCSPVIEVKAGHLDKEQIKWWQDLILKGMGQFFFENKLPFLKPKFVISRPRSIRKTFREPASDVLVPVGGGKDSAVTLELLKKSKKNVRCFSLNPTDSAMGIMKTAGCRKPIIAERTIDEKLLKLNRKGFLNGHTPFSAYLAFLTLLVAAIFKYRQIAVSNEKSSNEGNIKYLEKVVNHQWSKSFEFEKKFRKYCKEHLAENIEYFSYLRPLYEIQIAKLFSKHQKYFKVFLSCNEAYKTASGTKRPEKKWCGNCSKCLFTYMILYPYLKKEKLVNIFGKDLYEDKKLLPLLQQLTGERGFKPFECVGTAKESRRALSLSLKKAERLGEVPYLLTKLKA
ncbi:MAG: hypothetical protein ABH867_00955 [Patescibacteria group bacterium]